jgi:hypothetical protein
MKHQLGKITAHVTATALQEAEKLLIRPEVFDRENCPQLVSALQDVIERELRGQGSDPEGD